MNYEFDIDIPTSLRGVKLKDWVKFMDIYQKNKDAESNDFIEKKMLEIFCGIDLKQVYDLPISSFDNVVSHLYGVLSEKTPLVNTFKMVGTDNVEVEFGFIPNLDKMSYGEWEDLENYIVDDKDIHKAMAVLYRPLVYEIGGKYRIHKYNGTEYYSDIMKDMPIDIALGAKVFFYRLVKKLGDYTIASTLKEYQKEKEGNSEQISEENGKAIKQYLSLQKEMSEELMKLQPSPFTSV